MPNDDLTLRLSRVRLVAFDVDGVLTDGRIFIGEDGQDRVGFHVRDGLGIRLLEEHGVRVALVSGRRTGVVAARGRILGLRHAYAGVPDKAVAIRKIAGEEGVQLDEILFLGDDVQDLPALLLVGVPAAVADAVREVRDRALLVTDAPGGGGAAREVAERVLVARGLYGDALSRYLEPK